MTCYLPDMSVNDEANKSSPLVCGRNLILLKHELRFHTRHVLVALHHLSIVIRGAQPLCTLPL